MTRLRTVAGVLLTLMIVSQSVLAVAAPCSSLNPGTAHHAQEMAGDTHAGHHMDAPAGGDDTSCCEGGYCSVSGCLSLAALHEPVCPSSLPVAMTVGQLPDGFFVSLDTETPHRPPIAR